MLGLVSNKRVPTLVILLLFTLELNPPPTKYVTVSTVFDGASP